MQNDSFLWSSIITYTPQTLRLIVQVLSQATLKDFWIRKLFHTDFLENGREDGREKNLARFKDIVKLKRPSDSMKNTHKCLHILLYFLIMNLSVLDNYIQKENSVPVYKQSTPIAINSRPIYQDSSFRYSSQKNKNSYLEVLAHQAFHKIHHRSDYSSWPTSHSHFQAILY